MNNVISITAHKDAAKAERRARINLIAERRYLEDDIWRAEHQANTFLELSKTMEHPGERFIARQMHNEKLQEVNELKAALVQVSAKIEG